MLRKFIIYSSTFMFFVSCKSGNGANIRFFLKKRLLLGIFQMVVPIIRFHT